MCNWHRGNNKPIRSKCVRRKRKLSNEGGLVGGKGAGESVPRKGENEP